MIGQMLCSNASHTSTESQNTEKVFVFQFTRMPRALVTALDTCSRLREVCDALQASGFSYRPQDKTRIFVWPEQYEAVMKAVGEKQILLKTSHVIALQSFMPVLEDIVSGFPSKSNVRINNSSKATVVDIISSAGPRAQTSQEDSDFEDFEWAVSEERTFLTYGRVRQPADTVTQSTTEVHGAKNPRR